MRFVKAFCIKKTVKIKKFFGKKLKFLYFIMPGLYKNKQKNGINVNIYLQIHRFLSIFYFLRAVFIAKKDSSLM